jgi:hypothetical protein
MAISAKSAAERCSLAWARLQRLTVPRMLAHVIPLHAEMMLEHFAGLLESARHQSPAPRVIFLMPPWAAGLIMSHKIHDKSLRQARKIFNKVKLVRQAWGATKRRRRFG